MTSSTPNNNSICRCFESLCSLTGTRLLSIRQKQTRERRRETQREGEREKERERGRAGGGEQSGSPAEHVTLLPASDHSARPRLFHVKQPLFLTARLLKTTQGTRRVEMKEASVYSYCFCFLSPSFLFLLSHTLATPPLILRCSNCYQHESQTFLEQNYYWQASRPSTHANSHFSAPSRLVCA